jgi:hypothetical protein
MATMAFVVAVQLELMASRAEPEVLPPSTDDVDAAPARTDVAGQNDALVDYPFEKATSAAGEASPTLEVAHSPSWSPVAGAGPAVGLGLAPNAILQGRLFFAAEFERAAIELGVEASWPTTTYQDHGGGFRHELLLGTLAACARRQALEFCGLGKLGVLVVRGLAVDRAASPAGFVAQVGPRSSYSLALSDSLALLAHVDALFLLTPWTVDVNHTALWTMPRFGVTGGIDLAVHFR